MVCPRPSVTAASLCGQDALKSLRCACDNSGRALLALSAQDAVCGSGDWPPALGSVGAGGGGFLVGLHAAHRGGCLLQWRFHGVGWFVVAAGNGDKLTNRSDFARTFFNKNAARAGNLCGSKVKRRNKLDSCGLKVL